MSISAKDGWTPLTELVDLVLSQEARFTDRDNTHFHPSEWHGCKRRIAYKYYEAKNFIQIDRKSLLPSPRLQRIFDNGTWMHDRWTKYVSKLDTLYGKWKCTACQYLHGEDAKYGILRPKRCKSCSGNQFVYIENGFTSDELMVGGHVDAIVGTEITVDGKSYSIDSECDKILIDYKSMNPFKFGDLKEPLPSHITQMHIYLMLADLPIGRFIYENKGNQDVLEFRVKRDELIIEKLKKEMSTLKYIVTHKNSKARYALPPRAHSTRSADECKNCEYKGHCWK